MSPPGLSLNKAKSTVPKATPKVEAKTMVSKLPINKISTTSSAVSTQKNTATNASLTDAKTASSTQRVENVSLAD